MTSETQKNRPMAKPNRPMHERAIRAAKGHERKSAETAVLSDDVQIALAQELVATGDVIADLIGDDTMLDPWDDSSIEIVSSPGDRPAISDLNSASAGDLVAGGRASRSVTDDDERAQRHGGRADAGDQQAAPLAIAETQTADRQASSETDDGGKDDLMVPDWWSDEESSPSPQSSPSPTPDQTLSPWQRRRVTQLAWRGLTTMEAIVRLAWKHALTGETGKTYRKLMASSRQALIIVVVPSIDWNPHIKTEIDTSLVRIIEGDSVGRSGLSKSGSELEEALQKQKSVIYLTTDLSKVPAILQASHDLLITVPPPDADLIGALLRLTGTGTLRSTLDPDFIRSFDLIDLSVAIRAGEPIESSIARLHQIKSRRSKALGDVNVPLLSETAAYGEAGDWGRQLATDIADYRRGKIAWGHIDRGAVIYGPPGTGKSYFARSLARTCEIPIVITSAGEWFATSAGHLDSVIKAVRKVFDEARQKAPAILFIDEIDAIPNRETLTSRNGDWWLPVVNDILLLLDNATSDRAGVIVIGATNRPNAIDPAILRPGRLERAVELAPTTL